MRDKKEKGLIIIIIGVLSWLIQRHSFVHSFIYSSKNILNWKMVRYINEWKMRYFWRWYKLCYKTCACTMALYRIGSKISNSCMKEKLAKSKSTIRSSRLIKRYWRNQQSWWFFFLGKGLTKFVFLAKGSHIRAFALKKKDVIVYFIIIWS